MTGWNFPSRHGKAGIGIFDRDGLVVVIHALGKIAHPLQSRGKHDVPGRIRHQLLLPLFTPKEKQFVFGVEARNDDWAANSETRIIVTVEIARYSLRIV